MRPSKASLSSRTWPGRPAAWELARAFSRARRGAEHFFVSHFGSQVFFKYFKEKLAMVARTSAVKVPIIIRRNGDYTLY